MTTFFLETRVVLSHSCGFSKVGIIHGCLNLSNIVRIRATLAFTDLSGAIMSSEQGVFAESFGGISQEYKSALLPPEMLYRINVSEDKNLLLQYETYWSHLLSDARDMKLFTPDDIKIIDQVLRLLLSKRDTVRTEVGHSTPLRVSMKSTNSNEERNEDWRHFLSDSLIDMTVDDLPDLLSTSASLSQFFNSWEMMKKNAKLWSKFCPRLSPGGRFAYIIKCFDDSGKKPDHDLLPYDLISATESIDVWAFGNLLFTMMSGRTLFHQTQEGNLANTWAFEQLYSWSEGMAREEIMSGIDDPLAQDLLIQILAQENERISCMDQVLEHPFFGPSSDVEAQKIMKKHSKEKNAHELNSQSQIHLLKQKRAIISMEKTCKIVFDRLDDIMVPTRFIVLPYLLEWDKYTKRGEVRKENHVLADKIGFHLLNIHSATAKLMFWLKVKESLTKDNGKAFKAKIISWINRARSESSCLIAEEIVFDIGQSRNYEGIFVEMLDEAMEISKAAKFMKDPMHTARTIISEHADALLDCYHDHYLYVIDEYTGNIVLHSQDVYPIKINDPNVVRNVMMPFINMSIISTIASFGLKGVARLVGLPFSSNIPQSWIKCSLGLVEQESSLYDESSIVDFATLQQILRTKDSQHIGMSFSSIDSIEEEKVQHGHLNDNSLEGLELLQLEIFYNEQDIVGSYAGLHRQYDHDDDSTIIWTNHIIDGYTRCETGSKDYSHTIERLNELQQEIVKKKRMEGEIFILIAKVKEMKKKAEKKRADQRSRAIRKKERSGNKTRCQRHIV